MSATPRPFAQTLRHIRALAGEPQRLGDGPLLDRFVHDHDESAFAELLRRHGPLVMGVARRRLADRHAADDVFQATFLALARQPPRFAGQGSLTGWLYTVASRLARKEQARSARRPKLWPDDPSTPTPPGADPLAQVSGRELVAIIDDELARLPEHYRVPLLLCGLDGLTRDETAARLGWSLGTLRGRLERGRDLLRRRLTARGLTVPAVLAGVLTTEAAVPRELVAATSRAALAALTAPAAWGSLKVVAAAAVVLTALGAGVGVSALMGPASRERERPEVVLPPVAYAPSSPRIPQPAAPVPRVDAEGVPLPPGALARMGSSRMRHAGGALSVVVAPDGKTLASAGLDGVRIWEIATGKPVRFVPAQDGALRFWLRFADDGHDLLCLAVGSGSAFWRLDPATGRERLRNELKNAVYPGGLGLSWSGRRFAYTHVDKSVRICDATTGQELRSIDGLGDGARWLDFTPDDGTLAIANGSDTLRLHDATTGAVTAELKRENSKLISVALSPDGQSLVTISDGHPFSPDLVAVWDVATRKVVRHLVAEGQVTPRAACFSHDGRLVAVNWQRAIVLWDTATGRVIHTLSCPGALQMAFTPDGRTLAAAIAGGTIVLFDLATGQVLPASADPITGPFELYYTDGRRRLVGVGDRIVVWDPTTGREVHRFPDLPTAYGLPVLSPDERLVATQTREAAIRLNDATTGREVRTLVRGEKQIFPSPAYRFTPDGRRLIASDFGFLISVWDVNSGARLHDLVGHNGSVDTLAISPDGHWVASATTDSRFPQVDYAIRLWDLTTYQEVRRFVPRKGEVLSVAFSPDCRLLASAGGDLRGDDTGTVQVWDIASGRELRSFTGHAAVVTRIAFSPDGRMLATGADDTTVRLWEVASGGERKRITDHTGRIRAIAFSPDGWALAAASLEAPVYIWDILGRLEPPTQPPTAAELEQVWSALASTDAKAAFQAIRRLVGAPEPAVAFLRERLTPVVAINGERVRALIRQLDSLRFAERQQAAQELDRIADQAAAEMRAALPGAISPEVRQALQQLLNKVEAGSPEALRAQRAVEALEYIGTPAARAHLKALADGAAGAALTDAAAAALKRLEK